ncbi:hypothetical protein [Agromyces sp. GXS1127]|uniref:hypothetical protein n=1 Tax=Agromyces sp. GXS1127 TaxID=3424181 RepID=UPI003D31E73E
MLDATESGATAVGTAVIPVVVAVLTVVGAAVSTRFGHGGDDLRRAEQLTAVLAGMSPSAERDLVERVRDRHAAAYALSASAPALGALRVAAVAAEASGIAVILVGALYVLLAPGFQPWFWATYLVGAVLLAFGAGAGHLRRMRRREWMAAERDRLGLRPAEGS